MRPAFALGLAVVALAAACRREAAPARSPELETVDVAPQPDAAASLEGDVVERRAAPPPGGVAGVLPEGFPRDVPLPSPSSLVDFGPGPASGGASITLEVQLAPDAARRAYEAQLAAAGFRRGGDGAWTRGDRRLAVATGAFGGAARLTVEVLPGP